MELRQSTSQIIRFGPFANSADGVTPETGLIITQSDMKLSKDGGAFAQKNAAGNAVHDVDGYYFATLDATDTNTTAILKFQVTVAGSVLVWENYQVVTQTYYDAKHSGTFNNLGGTAQTADHTAAIDNVDTVVDLIKSDTTAILVDTGTTLPANQTIINDNVLLIPTTPLLAANYTAPDNASITSILADTNELQLNQGSWLTADVSNIPTSTEFNARSIPSADYFVVTDYTAPDNAGITQAQSDIAALNDITVANIFAGGDVDGYSLEEALKLILSASVGVLSGAATNSVVIKAADNSKTRITATVDLDGNRSVVVKDVAG